MDWTDIVQTFKDNKACQPGLEFIKDFTSKKQAWSSFTQSDYMIWMAVMLDKDVRPVLLQSTVRDRDQWIDIYDKTTDKRARAAIASKLVEGVSCDTIRQHITL